jgi:hypothetical protein
MIDGLRLTVFYSKFRFLVVISIYMFPYTIIPPKWPVIETKMKAKKKIAIAM